MTFIYSEDMALKQKLTGITVSDNKNSERAVGVWFGQPDLEIREQSYPYLTIDMLNISEDNSRSHRGVIELEYNSGTFSSEESVGVEYPIPVDIYYQVTSYSRHPRHDRDIMSKMLTSILPFRFNTLAIEDDGTIRRLDLLGFNKRDIVENNKRLFVTTFSIKVSSEIVNGYTIDKCPVENVNTTYTILEQEIQTNP